MGFFCCLSAQVQGTWDCLVTEKMHLKFLRSCPIVFQSSSNSCPQHIIVSVVPPPDLCFILSDFLNIFWYPRLTCYLIKIIFLNCEYEFLKNELNALQISSDLCFVYFMFVWQLLTTEVFNFNVPKFSSPYCLHFQSLV